MMLSEGETVDDLQYEGLRIIQKKGTFRYGTDGVLLANYAVAAAKGAGLAKAGPGGVPGCSVKVLDVGTGTGIVPILMCGKLSGAGATFDFTAVDIQPDMCDMARRSVALNGQQDSVRILNADIRSSGLRRGSFDIVTVNPPYVRKGGGITSDVSGIACSRHEICGTQEEIFAEAARLLRYRGILVSVNRPDRLTDALCAMREGGAEPFELVMVHPFAGASPAMFLCSARKGGGKGLRVLPPMILEDR